MIQVDILFGKRRVVSKITVVSSFCVVHVGLCHRVNSIMIEPTFADESVPVDKSVS